MWQWRCGAHYICVIGGLIATPHIGESHTHLVLQIVHGCQSHDDDDVLRLNVPEDTVE